MATNRNKIIKKYGHDTLVFLSLNNSTITYKSLIIGGYLIVKDISLNDLELDTDLYSLKSLLGIYQKNFVAYFADGVSFYTIPPKK